MAAHKLVYAFPVLSLLGLYLLWIVMLRNGTIDGLNQATSSGNFLHGRELLTTYLRIPLLDGPISTVVAFFDGQTDGSDPGRRLLMVDFLGTLQTVVLWTLVESLRTENKPMVLKMPAVWGLLWNASGSALILPIYLYFHLKWWLRTARDSKVEAKHARVLSTSILVGGFLPAVIMMLPPYVKRTATEHQTIVALFQASPVYVVAIHYAGMKLMSLLGRGEETPHEDGTNSVRRVYLLTGIISAISHLYVFGSTIFTQDTRTSFSRVYVPAPGAVDRKSAHIVEEGALLFLQYDWAITTCCCALWVFLLLRKDLEKPLGWGDVARLTGILLVSVMLGPGAVGSLGLWQRESGPDQYSMASRISKGKQQKHSRQQRRTS